MEQFDEDETNITAMMWSSQSPDLNLCMYGSSEV